MRRTPGDAESFSGRDGIILAMYGRGPYPARMSRLGFSLLAAPILGTALVMTACQPQAPAPEPYLSVVEADGYTCAAAFGGTRCDKLTSAGDFPVDSVETVFTRDDTWIYVGVSNLDASALLPDIVATAWSAEHRD